MTTEDDHVEVYRELDRTRSDVDKEALREAFSRREAEAKQESQLQMYGQLNHDLKLARRWLVALANKSIHMEKEGSLPAYHETGYAENEDIPPTPFSGFDLDEIVHFLDKWQKYPGLTTAPHEPGDGIDTEVDVAELVVRTARRLQSDCFRLLNLVAFLVGRETDLNVDLIDWMVPYLEGQLKLFKGKYKHFTQETNTYQPHDLDALAARYALERKLSSEAKILLGEPFENFKEPRFDQEGVEPLTENDKSNTVQKPRFESASDHLSPGDPNIGVEKDNRRSSRPRTETEIAQQGMQSPCHLTSTKERNTDALDPNAKSQIGRLAQKLIKSNHSKQTHLGKAITIGETLLKENARLKRNLKKQAKQLEEEAEKRRISERQITENLDKSKGALASERPLERGDAIAANIRAEEKFQIKRDRLSRQIQEFKDWRRTMKREEAERGLKREESRLHKGHDDLMNHLQRNLKKAEMEREAAWVEFIAGIDGISDSDKKIWRALRGVTRCSGPIPTKADEVPILTHTNLECLYCDKEGCCGCAGDGKEYDKPWLEL
jgi:RNA binding exosome subunit